MVMPRKTAGKPVNMGIFLNRLKSNLHLTAKIQLYGNKEVPEVFHVLDRNSEMYFHHFSRAFEFLKAYPSE
jgi:hypothetical protein